jgi:hypothetical protein
MQRLWTPVNAYAVLITMVAIALVTFREERISDDVGEAATISHPAVCPVDALEQQHTTVHIHGRAQRRVVSAVIAGRSTLPEGAKQLLDLHAVNPYFNWQAFRHTFSAATDLERCCQQMLALVDQELADEPVRGEAVRARLAAEADGSTLP